MKGLKQHYLDFEIIPSTSCKTLIFVDASDYFKEPERPLLEIYLPGSTKYFLVNITPRQVNTFNSNTIGLTELLNNGELVDLPDGAWHFRYKVCPYEVVYEDKCFFRTCHIERRLCDIYEKLEATDCATKTDEKVLHDISEVHVLIEGAKQIVCSNEKKANEFYQLAERLMANINNKLCKTC